MRRGQAGYQERAMTIERNGIVKKGATFKGEASAALRGMSKAALLDCLLDAIALQNECDPPFVTVAMVAEFCNQRLTKRGDKVVNP
jgi:hypothetical protein